MANQPKSVNEIRKNAKLMAAYLAYAKKRVILNEVMFYVNKGNNYEVIYKKYLDSKSKDQVNCDSKVYKAGEILASKSDWDNKAWPKIVAMGKKSVGNSLDNDLGAFYSSSFYKDFMVKSNMGSPAKAAKILGISDPKKLKLMMEAQVVGNKKLAKKLWDEIAKKEKIKDKYESTMKTLQKSGLV
jgi:hypothetical protein